MGAGRVGTSLATTLDRQGHSVALIDQNPDAFRRLSSDFSGRRVTGNGFDRDTLRQAGIAEAYAFAAVSSGDNSNIIAARVVRETFGIQRVVARIYDPARAQVYERLGIPTVATVRRTTEAVLNWMMPPDANVVWEHETGEAGLIKARPIESWYGLSFATVADLVAAPVVFVNRLGHLQVATADLLVQENDELYFAVSATPAQQLRDVLTRDPQVEV